MKRKEASLSTPYNVVAALDTLRDRYNNELTDRERMALIVAANVILSNQEQTVNELKRHI